MSEPIKKNTPEIIRRWNWGAFVFSWIWAIANNVWIGLLALVPLVNIVMIFVLGAKGNQWAWEKYESDNVEAFLQRQRKWNIAAAIFGLLIVGLFVILFSTLGIMTYKINTGETKDRALAELNSSVEVVEMIGAPIVKNSFIGFNSQSKLLKNGNMAGMLVLNFDIKGSSKEGSVTMLYLDYEGKSDLVYMEITPKGEETVTIIDKTVNENVGAILAELSQNDPSSP